MEKFPQASLVDFKRRLSSASTVSSISASDIVYKRYNPLSAYNSTESLVSWASLAPSRRSSQAFDQVRRTSSASQHSDLPSYLDAISANPASSEWAALSKVYDSRRQPVTLSMDQMRSATLRKINSEDLKYYATYLSNPNEAYSVNSAKNRPYQFGDQNLASTDALFSCAQDYMIDFKVQLNSGKAYSRSVRLSHCCAKVERLLSSSLWDQSDHMQAPTCRILRICQYALHCGREQVAIPLGLRLSRVKFSNGFAEPYANAGELQIDENWVDDTLTISKAYVKEFTGKGKQSRVCILGQSGPSAMLADMQLEWSAVNDLTSKGKIDDLAQWLQERTGNNTKGLNKKTVQLNNSGGTTEVCADYVMTNVKRNLLGVPLSGTLRRVSKSAPSSGPSVTPPGGKQANGKKEKRSHLGFQVSQLSSRR